LRAASEYDVRLLEALWCEASTRGVARQRVRLASADGESESMDVTLTALSRDAAQPELLLECRAPVSLRAATAATESMRVDVLVMAIRRLTHAARTRLGTIRNVAELASHGSEDPAQRARYAALIDRAVSEIDAMLMQLGGAVPRRDVSSRHAKALVRILDPGSETGDGALEGALVIRQAVDEHAIPDEALRSVAQSLLRVMHEGTLGRGGIHVLATRVDDDAPLFELRYPAALRQT
jgi:hypothetical protein